MKKNMLENKKIQEKYYSLFKNMENYYELPKNKYVIESANAFKYSFIDNTKQINDGKIKKICETSNVTEQELFLATFMYTLSRYVGNNNLLFSVLIANKFMPISKEIKEKNIFSFLKNVKKLFECVKEIAESSLIYDDKTLHNSNTSLICYLNNNDIKEIEDFKKYCKNLNDKEKNVFLFNVCKIKDDVNIIVRYEKNYFELDFIKNITESFFLVLNSILEVKDVRAIKYISELDLNVLNKMNDTNIKIYGKNIPELFEKKVLENKNKIALICGNEHLTYEELNCRANQVANELIKVEVKKQEVVTIMLDRSIYSPIARQGILKAGGAFLNILPDYPRDRINYILDDCKSKIIITTEKIKKERKELFDELNVIVLTMEEISRNKNVKNLKINIKPNSLCYCIYTSGSTGKPKGVMIEHKNLINYCIANKYNREASVVGLNVKASLALASFTFDVSILEEFIPLLNGGTMVIATEDEIYNPTKLAKLIKNRNVEVITCTPSYINNIIEIEEIQQVIKYIKRFNIGAETFPPYLFSKIRKLNNSAQIFNGYGPTETTIGCTFTKIDQDDDITIGTPMANTKIYILNKERESLPIGVPGELAILGNGVGRGYINRKELNEDKFININGQKAYRSGDLAKINRNGEIEFISRIDNQVKINGLRIELGEIEEVINSYENVIASIVTVIDDVKGKYICAYINSDSKVDIDKLKEYIKEKLPNYMIPKRFIQLDSFPLNNNGKIDKKQLPIPVQNGKNEHVKPKNETEYKLCEIIKNLLDLKEVGTNDDFFELGGDSLDVMRFITLATQENMNIRYKDIFDYPVIRDLSDLLLSNITKNNKTKDLYNYNYDKLHYTIANNKLENVKKIQDKKINNIVISGATGFLGIHVLWEFIKNNEGIAYCFIRKGRFKSLEERMNFLFNYYFGKEINEYLNKRVYLIEGDITDKNSFENLNKCEAEAFINCAAIVKYFNAGKSIERVNVEGVKNIINYCKEKKIELIQISTTSIGGTKEVNQDIKPFNENDLYFGQSLENSYSATKFMAERMIIEEIQEGLNAKIMRVGNLMPRNSDNTFQINYLDNGFLESLRAFKLLKSVPASIVGKTIELSPVDITAKSILILMNTNEEYNVFHPFNNNSIHYYDIFHAMKEYGYEINIVSDDEFNNKLKNEILNNNKTERYIGLFADLTASDSKKAEEIDANNAFTTEMLYNMNFIWPSITEQYLINNLKKLEKFKYFDE